MRLLWRLLGYLKPYLWRMVLASVLMAVSGVMMAVVISTVKPLVNEVLQPGSAAPVEVIADPAVPAGLDILEQIKQWLPLQQVQSWARARAFVQVPLLIVGIFFVRGLFLYFGQYFTIKAGASVIRDIRAELYESVAHQSLTFFQKNTTGTIVSRILNDVMRLQRVTTVVLADLVRTLAMVPFLLLTAFLHDWRMSLLAIVTLPLLGVPMVKLGRRLKLAATRSQEFMADVTSLTTESVSGIKVVQGFGMEDYEVGRFRLAINRMLRADLKAGRALALAPAIMELLGAAVGGGLFYLAGLHIAKKNLDPGNFAVVLFCLGLMFMSTRRLNHLYSEIQSALSAAARVFEMLDHESEIRDRPGAKPLPAFDKSIRFDQLEFSYGDERVLDIDELVIERGQMIALVGASGAGKSTLANMLARFYDPTAGSIRIDGTDVRDVTLDSLRSQIGLVTQETVLFDDTVRNNIAYGREDIPMERVEEVARASQAHEFICRLPKGYDTVLGERGARLSMGQRQRVTIARALLKDPPILILDEATSSLDVQSEAKVQKALEALMRGRTSVVIAHRLSTVRNADRILVMEQGEIVEHGTHNELLERNGIYSRLYDLQFKDPVA